MQMASLLQWRWMRATFSNSIENITGASDALVNGLSAWSSMLAADVGWRLLCVEMYEHLSALSVIMCCQERQSSRTLGEDIKMWLSNNGVYDHAVILHAHEFVDSVDPDIHTETIEGLWMQAKRKLRYVLFVTVAQLKFS